METHIGYPVELLENSKLEELYNGVSCTSFNDNTVTISRGLRNSYVINTTLRFFLAGNESG